MSNLSTACTRKEIFLDYEGTAVYEDYDASFRLNSSIFFNFLKDIDTRKSFWRSTLYCVEQYESGT
jgi:hypothetical protein